MNIPETLKYTHEHEWVRIDEEASTEDQTIAYLGITDYAQGELGELVYIEVDTVGETLDKDEIFGTVEAVKTTSELFMPVRANILEMNPELDDSQGDNPGLINEDPYGDGWIVKMAIEDPGQLEELLDAAAYQELIA